MPLQNRVTPFGEIIATPERGTMLGNRGILHNDRKEIIRTSQIRRWLCCVLEFKGIRRKIMDPHSYTELFFLDEATALAAGHRPCFECRRKAALDFQFYWTKVFDTKANADEIDQILEYDRKVPGSGKKRYKANMLNLPDGTFIADRKSTRLNSSHQIISYAVFCLKKKNDIYLQNSRRCHIT